MFYTPVFVNDHAAEPDWFAYVRHSARNDIGYRWTFKRIGNVHAVYSIEEGTLRPAWTCDSPEVVGFAVKRSTDGKTFLLEGTT